VDALGVDSETVALDDAEASRRRLAAMYAWATLTGPGPWKLDVLECEDFDDLVEVGVAMEQRNGRVR
jgi:hypothetical protein